MPQGRDTAVTTSAAGEGCEATTSVVYDGGGLSEACLEGQRRSSGRESSFRGFLPSPIEETPPPQGPAAAHAASAAEATHSGEGGGGGGVGTRHNFCLTGSFCIRRLDEGGSDGDETDASDGGEADGTAMDGAAADGAVADGAAAESARRMDRVLAPSRGSVCNVPPPRSQCRTRVTWCDAPAVARALTLTASADRASARAPLVRSSADKENLVPYREATCGNVAADAAVRAAARHLNANRDFGKLNVAADAAVRAAARHLKVDGDGKRVTRAADAAMQAAAHHLNANRERGQLYVTRGSAEAAVLRLNSKLARRLTASSEGSV